MCSITESALIHRVNLRGILEGSRSSRVVFCFLLERVILDCFASVRYDVVMYNERSDEMSQVVL